MTVAAVILSATAEGALAPTLGQARVRRLADLAWSGGALPVVVVSADPDGAVKAALAGSEAIHGLPAPAETGPIGQMLRGIELATSEVSDVTGALLWPARMTWVGPETITSLIETHGGVPGEMLRPAWHGEPGWPVLMPVGDLTALRAIGPDVMPQAIVEALVAAMASRVVELGDPGVVHDAETRFDALPAYEGPPGPPGDHRHEWGEDVEAEAGLDPA